MTRDAAVVLDLLKAARLTIEFTTGLTQGTFLADIKTQSAVQHQLMVFGEAVKRLSPTFRTNHPELPWRSIARMRDRLIHGYDTIDLDIVWEAATVEMPVLPVLEALALPEPPEGEP